EGPLGTSMNPALFRLETVMESPCLVLLGEPGIGKSTTVNQELNALERRLVAGVDVLLPVDLRDVGSDGRLCARIFEDPKFLHWESGTHQLHLFIDSLDECLLRVDTVGQVLIEELQRRDRSRLKLRIACRTAEWPKVLQVGLASLWPQNEIRYCELQPLRVCDIEAAAVDLEVDTESFLREVIKRDAAGFAMRPVTLRALLRAFKVDRF